MTDIGLRFAFIVVRCGDRSFVALYIEGAGSRNLNQSYSTMYSDVCIFYIDDCDEEFEEQYKSRQENLFSAGRLTRTLTAGLNSLLILQCLKIFVALAKYGPSFI